MRGLRLETRTSVPLTLPSPLQGEGEKSLLPLEIHRDDVRSILDRSHARAVIFGLVVRIGARLYDTSLKSRLQRLQYAMKGAA